MKFMLAAINAKYIHMNLALYSLRANALCALSGVGHDAKDGQMGFNCGQGVFGNADMSEEIRPEALSRAEASLSDASGCEADICLAEYTINQPIEQILADIYGCRPDVLFFSCYLWNISVVRLLVPELKKVLPELVIWLGGPEVSYDAEEELRMLPEADGILVGEGESTFRELVAAYERGEGPSVQIHGLVFRGDAKRRLLSNDSVFRETGEASRVDGDSGLSGNGEGLGLAGDSACCEIIASPARLAEDFAALRFPYMGMRLPEHKIIYYESSRGCPFSCSYCLSSVDRRLRFRTEEQVERELDFFLAQRPAQVKFVDRTFNCDRKRALWIWNYLGEHDNGVTNFHFEIAADLLDEEQLSVLARLRPGQVQLEIGVQSINPDTLAAVNRRTDLELLRRNVLRIKQAGNIHQHLDLIAGLPYEDWKSFVRSFNWVYALQPEQLQLGFLKVLKGAPCYAQAESQGLRFTSFAPYEVLQNRWISYAELLLLKGVESMVEIYYNSGQFTQTLAEIQRLFGESGGSRMPDSPFGFYLSLFYYYRCGGLDTVSHSRMQRYDILLAFLTELDSQRQEKWKELLLYDLYLRENLKQRPSWAPLDMDTKDRIREYYRTAGLPKDRNSHLERFLWLGPERKEEWIRFDYTRRDPLSHNAVIAHVSVRFD